MSDLPMHTFKAKAPYVGAVESVEKLVRPEAPGEVRSLGRRYTNDTGEGRDTIVFLILVSSLVDNHRNRLDEEPCFKVAQC